MNIESIYPLMLLSIIGFIGMNISPLIDFLKRNFASLIVKSVRVEESSDFYQTMQKYITEVHSSRIRNFYYRTFYDGANENKDSDLLYNMGLIRVRHGGSWIFIYKNTYELKNASFPWKTDKNEINLYSTNRGALVSFTTYIYEKYGKTELKSYFNNAGTVQKLSKIPPKTFDNIFLNGNLKETIISDLQAFIDGEEKYKQMGLKYKHVYLFYGSAGSGKSSIITAIANYTQRPILSINKSKEMTDDVLVGLIANRPKKSIICFEDIDCLFENLDREGGDEVKNEHKISLSCILNILDGGFTPDNCIFILTTNHIDKLDSALKRSGRCNLTLEIDAPNQETKQRYIEYLQKIKPSFSPQDMGNSLASIEQQFLNT